MDHINHSKLEFNGSAGVSSVNLYTGNMIFQHPDISMGANSFEIDISHIYNCNDFSLPYNSYMGKNWKLNIQQYLGTNNSGGYDFIDEIGYKHEFVEYASFQNTPNQNQTTYRYYDTAGSDLRLEVIKEISKININTIIDSKGNKRVFDNSGKLINIISGVNNSIVKTINYMDDKVYMIYDNRKGNRFFEFNYSDNKLLEILCKTSPSTSLSSVPSIKYKLIFHYEDDNLVKIDKSTKDKKINNVALFSYKNGKMAIASNSVGNSAQWFIYNNDKIQYLYLGATTLKNEQSKNVCLQVGDGLRCGEISCGEPGDTNLEFNSKSNNRFDYFGNSTIVTNTNDVMIRYFFNEQGFTCGTLEKDRSDEQYRTLTKTKGWELVDFDKCDGNTFINGKRSFTVTKNENTTNMLYNIDSNKVEEFKGIFKHPNTAKSKYYYNDRFIVSFWAKLNNAGNDLKAIFTYRSQGKDYTFQTMIDSAPGVWQYVNIPIRFDYIDSNYAVDKKISEIKSNISSMELSFYGQDTTVEVADLRIAVGNYNELLFNYNDGDNVKYVNFADVHTLQFDGNKVAINNEFFMTDADIFETYKNIFNKKDDEPFDFIYCGGTKRKSVKSAGIYYENKEINFVDKDDDDNNFMPNYYYRSNNRIGDDEWCETKIQPLFNRDIYGKFYTIETVMGTTKNFYGLTDDDSYSENFEWTYLNGLPRGSKDEYNIITKNYYDAYGNIVETQRYNEFNLAEVLTVKYDYGTTGEADREMPLSITQNGITQKMTYEEPFLQISKSQVGNESEVKYGYYSDNLLGRVETLSGNAVIDNFLEYDYRGRLNAVQDNVGHRYEFDYNAYGDISCYRQNGREILRKEIVYSQNGDQIKEWLHKDSDSSILTEAELNKYGKINYQRSNGKKIEYKYQIQGNENFVESNSLAKIKQIIDPYGSCNYNYYYDEDNNPYMYTKANNSTNEILFSVRQATTGKIEYKLNGGETRISEIIYENTDTDGRKKVYLNPRIYMTKDYSEDSKITYEDTYEYDTIGRIQQTTTVIKQNTMELKIVKENSYLNGTTLLSMQVSNIYYIGLNNGYEPKPKNNKTIITKFFEKYDERGNVLKICEDTERFVFSNDEVESSETLPQRVIEYEYDNQNHLISENVIEGGIGNRTEYTYNKGQLTNVNNKETIKQFEYNNGQKISCNENAIIYDYYGNVTGIGERTLEWDERNLLSKNNLPSLKGDVKYQYDYQKVLTQAYNPTDNILRKYYVDGNRILGEDWYDYDEGQGVQGERYSKIRYYYSATGYVGFSVDGIYYSVLLDEQQNVTKVFSETKEIGEYKYDAWGNCEVIPAAGISQSEDFALYNQGIRWKSYYCDAYVKCYYIAGRWYDPELMQYLDADKIENILFLASELNSLDRNAIITDNILDFEANTDNIFTSGELFVDPTDENADKSWWDVHWKIVAGGAIITGLAIGSIFTGGTLSVLLSGATIGALGGGVSATISTAISGNWENFENSFLIGTITGGISGTIGATGLGKGAQIGANTLLGLGHYAATTALNGGQFTLGGIISSVVFGGIIGVIGGAGLMDGSNRIIDDFVLFTGKNYLATMAVNISHKIISEYLFRIFINTILIGGILNGAYSRFLNRNKNPNNDFFGW